MLDIEAAYREHYGDLVRLARLIASPAEAEDTVQAVFVKIASNPSFPAPDSVIRYLQRCVVNQSRTEYRRRSRETPSEQPMSNEAAPTSSNDLSLTVRGILRELPPRQREAVVLRYFLDLSEVDTARMMGIRLGSVKSATHRALEQLERRFREENVA